MNILIPNPTLYVIEYTDSKGEKTKRTIVPISQTADSITAYCYLGHGIRSFKKADISDIQSTSERPSDS